jgi:hypothetical protein
MVLIGAAPATTLAACSLMPDLPLLSLSLSGMAVTLAGWARIGALLVGLGALFRFSALALVPVVALAAALAQPPGRRWMIAVQCTILAMLPSILLALHDLDAYGEVHLLAMVGFQSVSNDGDSLVDCCDTDCGGDAACAAGGAANEADATCTDCIDNDSDGYADAEDWDCSGGNGGGCRIELDADHLRRRWGLTDE